ncbi:MAG: Nif11-like leader peptide family RiPP precursor [Oscillospiraceae bacterium]|nr:Nif11-like leader peptide family RiPP precursor [Oscillospiraceae bacterium]
MNEKLKKLEMLKDDEDFRKQLGQAKTNEEILKLVESKGIALTGKEVFGLCASMRLKSMSVSDEEITQLPDNGELSEADLELVAGGTNNNSPTLDDFIDAFQTLFGS